MSTVRVISSSGETFSVAGCRTVGELKNSILENTGMPIDKQQLRRINDKEAELKDEAIIEADEELELLVEGTNGGCEVRPFFLKIHNFECKFRSEQTT